jgi:cobalt transporter subunit CbtA
MTRATRFPFRAIERAAAQRVISRVLIVGLLAGLVAGLAVAALQHVTTTPLIKAAEVYEAAQHKHEASAEPAGWEPAEGFERAAATSVATVVTSVGYALVLIALLLVANEPIKPKRAMVWGVCAFLATGLATGLGLAPQLPGAAETDLVARQLWWIGAAASTGAGLYVVLRLESIFAKLAGVALIVAPHIIGAPQPAAPESTVPAEFAARFAAASLALHALTWILTALLVAVIWRFLAERDLSAAQQNVS